MISKSGDYSQVLWAMSWHVQPERDVYVVRDTAAVALDPSVAGEHVDQFQRRDLLSSKVGIDATRKHRFPARSIPPQEDLNRVDAHWAEYGFGEPSAGAGRRQPGRQGGME